jgi:NAD+ synthase (glutamine-hydrolysing)
LCITGYGCEDTFLSPETTATALCVLEELISETLGIICCVGLPYRFEGQLYNCAALLAEGRLCGLAGKQNLAGSGLHYEPRWFHPWPNNVHVQVSIAGQETSVGDVVFQCGGVRIGFEICEDAWVKNRVGRELAEEGVDIYLNPSASHFAFGKHHVRRELALEGSREFQAVYLFANLLGNEAGRAIYDGDAMVACRGELLVRTARFSFAEVELAAAMVEIPQVQTSRAARGRRTKIVTMDFEFPASVKSPPPEMIPAWESSRFLKEEEFTRAVALGLFDYLRKSHTHGFVVSISGGVDSAAVATLAACTVHLAVNQLGLNGLKQQLAYIDGLRACPDTRSVIGQLLTCVYQSTRNSSATTLQAARNVAQALGATFYKLDVDEVASRYVDLVSAVMGRRLTWERDDTSLQNIQARARGPSVWLVANLKQALLLTTSNRSEAAVGYATMDGDTCGGLAPIAGIDKTFLRGWLSWMEREGPEGFERLPALSEVSAQTPTAELRPPAAHQTDEEDLMPYPILDAIEKLAIRDKLGPVACLAALSEQFPGYDPALLVDWIERFFTLWCHNQWKRERYAPSFHVDDENLDPKTWCRFPILSGGYLRELRELRAKSAALNPPTQ